MELFTTYDRQELTNDELNDKLLKFLENIANCSGVERVYFDLLYKIGLRPSEPLDINCWSRLDNSAFLLLQPKTDKYREIPSELVHPVFAAAIDDQVNIFLRHNYQFLLSLYKTFSPLNGAIRQNRLIQLYAFRHNRVKMYRDADTSINDICKLFAWEDPNVLWDYLYSKIFI